MTEKKSAASLYDRDFYRWLQEQAAQLRHLVPANIDAGNIAEELDTLARAEAIRLTDSLASLIAALLNWQYCPSWRCPAARKTVEQARRKTGTLLTESPSLKGEIPAAMASAWSAAVTRLMNDTGRDENDFPASCPWEPATFLTPDFFPE